MPRELTINNVLLQDTSPMSQAFRHYAKKNRIKLDVEILVIAVVGKTKTNFMDLILALNVGGACKCGKILLKSTIPRILLQSKNNIFVWK